MQGLMDNSTLAEAYSLNYKPLFSYALFLTHNHAEAEDLVSEAFVKAILSWNGRIHCGAISQR